MNSAPRPGPFTVRFTEPARKVVSMLLRRSRRWGLWQRYTAALKAIERELETRPTTWGEERHRYAAAKLVGYHALHDQLHVVYAVHDEEAFVWITHLVPVLDHPLLDARGNGKPIR
jgi:hypothetical protein